MAKPDCGARCDKYEKLVNKFGSDQAEAKRLTDAYGAFCEREILEMLKNPPTMTLLEGLVDKGYALFIASATPEVNLAPMVARSPLAPLFEAVYGRPRSKATILGDICQAHGGSPHEIIMVGTGELDRQAAEEFDCEFIYVDVEVSAQPVFFHRMIDAVEGPR